MQDLASLVSSDQIKLEVTIRLGGISISVADLSRLSSGSILVLDRDISDGVEVCISGKVVAHGELTTDNDAGSRLAVRILSALN